MSVKGVKDVSNFKSKLRHGKATIRLLKDSRERTQVARQLKKIARERGNHSEDKVELVLQELKEEGKIVDYYRNNKLDQRGIDWMIVTHQGKIPMQVKSSYKGVAKHLELNAEHNTDIPVIKVRSGEGVESLKKKILFFVLKDNEAE
jgi:hypothetical protein